MKHNKPFLQNTIPRFARLLLMFAVLIPGNLNAQPRALPNTYTFAVVPQAAAEVMNRNWSPFLDALSRETGLTFRIRLYDKMSAFESDLKNGSVDFAYLNPVQAYVAWNTRGYIPLVRSRQPVTATLFVRKESPVQSLADLRGRSVGFVSPRSVCSILLLNDSREQEVKPEFYSTPGNVFKAVSLGQVAAGGILDVTLDDQTMAAREALRPIYTSAPISPHPIVASPSVKPEARKSVIDAILRLAQAKETEPLFRAIRLQDPIAADFERDYKPLARLNIQAFENAP